jgi:hypothetical protein
MSIEKTWGELNDRQDDDLSSLLQKPKLSKLSSHNPLEKIRKNLLLNMIWGIVICILYVIIIFYFRIWQVQLSLLVVLIFTIWAIYTAYQQYKNIHTNVSSSSPVLAEMRRQHQSITSWMNTQQRVALLVYPISAAGGFILGGVIGSGKSVSIFMSKPFVIIALLVSIAVLVPACYYLARWMFNYSFGKHLKALNENIRSLEDEK